MKKVYSLLVFIILTNYSIGQTSRDIFSPDTARIDFNDTNTFQDLNRFSLKHILTFQRQGDSVIGKPWKITIKKTFRVFQSTFDFATKFSSINFAQCRFESDLIKDNLEFENVYCEGDSHFADCLFDSNLAITSSQYKEAFQFSNSKLQKGILLTNDTFNGGISVFNTSCNYFNGYACIFGGLIQFYKYKGNSISIVKSGFNAPLVFDSTRIKDYLELSSDTFSCNAPFGFYSIPLPDTINLSGSKFGTPVNLLDANFEDHNRNWYWGGYFWFSHYKKHKICLYKTDISNLKLDYVHFQLYFAPYNGGHLPDYEIASIYESLLQNFKINNQYDSYELLDIEFKDFKNGWFILPHYWNCYGYHKEWIFYWTVFFLVLFTIITFYRIDNLTDSVYRVNYIPQLKSLIDTKDFASKVKNDKIKKGVFRQRWWYSFAYTATIFFLFGLKIEKLKYKNKHGLTYVVLVYSVGLLCMAYIINFVIQK